MKTQMIGRRHYLKICHGVVMFVAITMMHLFVGTQFTSKSLFHDPPMF